MGLEAVFEEVPVLEFTVSFPIVFGVAVAATLVFVVVAFESFRSRCSAPWRSKASWIFFIHSLATSLDGAAKKADLFV